MAKDKVIELDAPLEYAQKGEMLTGTFITLLAPTSKNMNECATLKQAFFRALPKSGSATMEVEDSDQDSDVTGDAVMTMISMSQDVELASVLVTGRELLTSGVALIEGEEKLTKPLADKLSQDDLEKLVGEYIATFIIASALRKAKKQP